jgi:hypothetical protein
LPRIPEQASGGVAWLAVGGVGLAAEQRVALQHHAPVRVVHGQHVGTGADRVPVERDVPGGKARLAVEAVGLPRHGREERHGEPVLELRVDVVQAYAQRVAVGRLDAGEREGPQIEPAGGGGLGEFGGEFGEAGDVGREQARDRRLHARARQALDLVGEVLGREFPAAALGEIAERIDLGERGGVELVVEQRAVVALGQRRMRGVADARPNVQLVYARCRERRVGVRR